MLECCYSGHVLGYIRRHHQSGGLARIRNFNSVRGCPIWLNVISSNRLWPRTDIHEAEIISVVGNGGVDTSTPHQRTRAGSRVPGSDLGNENRTYRVAKMQADRICNTWSSIEHPGNTSCTAIWSYSFTFDVVVNVKRALRKTSRRFRTTLIRMKRKHCWAFGRTLSVKK